MTAFNNNKNTPFKRTKKGTEPSFNPFDVGKLPPQAPDLEEAVLGAIMLEKNAMDEIADLIKPDVFYVDAHSRIFNACYYLYKKRLPIDLLTVVNRLKETAELEIVGGAYYVSKLTNRVASSANLPFHARIVFQKYMQRKVIEICTISIRDAFEDTIDVIDTIDTLETDIASLNQSASVGKKFMQVKDVWPEMRERNTTLLMNEGISGVRTGHNELDNVTGGWQPTDLIIIAGRPSMGKTAFILDAARETATRHNTPIAFFSLEMSLIQLVTRLVSQETDTELYKLNKQGIEIHDFIKIEDNLSKLFDAPLYIDDTPALSIAQLRSKVRKAKKELKIELVIIDYLQLMTVGGNENGGRYGNREQEISTISRTLKQIAKELEIPVIALAQLNRAVDTRADKRPKLADLRESGAIEQDADVVGFIHRPEYYGDNAYSDGSSTAGRAELIFGKHRNGDLTTVHFRFIGALTKFIDISNGDFSSNKQLQQHNLTDFTEPKSEAVIDKEVKGEQDDLPF
jgi:replicative DNA helicase